MKQKLTAKQQKFVNHYLKSGNGSEAAVKAGYAKNSARITAARLLTNVNIQKMISDRQSKAATQADVSLGWWLTSIKKLAEKAKKDGDKVRALELIGKHCGYFSADNIRRIDFNSMTDAELDVLIAGLFKIQSNG